MVCAASAWRARAWRSVVTGDSLWRQRMGTPCSPPELDEGGGRTAGETFQQTNVVHVTHSSGSGSTPGSGSRAGPPRLARRCDRHRGSLLDGVVPTSVT